MPENSFTSIEPGVKTARADMSVTGNKSSSELIEASVNDRSATKSPGLSPCAKTFIQPSAIPEGPYFLNTLFWPDGKASSSVELRVILSTPTEISYKEPSVWPVFISPFNVILRSSSCDITFENTIFSRVNKIFPVRFFNG